MIQAEGFPARHKTARFRSARASASGTTSTILPASWRKESAPSTSLDGGAVSPGYSGAERVTRRSGRHQVGGHRLQMGSERALVRDRRPPAFVEAGMPLRSPSPPRGCPRSRQVAADCFLASAKRPSLMLGLPTRPSRPSASRRGLGGEVFEPRQNFPITASSSHPKGGYTIRHPERAAAYDFLFSLFFSLLILCLSLMLSLVQRTSQQLRTWQRRSENSRPLTPGSAGAGRYLGNDAIAFAPVRPPRCYARRADARCRGFWTGSLQL